MKYLFEGDNFGFTKQELHLFGGNFRIKKTPLSAVSKIRIYKGVQTKYPIRTAFFGFSMILTAIVGILWFSNDYGIILLNKQFDGETARGFGGYIIVISVLVIVGKLALFSSLIKRIVFKVELTDGTVLVRSLNRLRKKNNLNQFLEFLIAHYSPEKLHIETKILNLLSKEKHPE